MNAVTAGPRGLRAIARRLRAAAPPGASMLLRNLHRLGRPPRGPVVVSTELGVAMVLDPAGSRGVDAVVWATGLYEAGTVQLVRALLREGDRMVDVGANVGLVSLAAAQGVGAAGRVIAFEPNPRALALLRATLETSGLGGRIEVRARALGSTSDTRALHARANLGAASLVGGAGPAVAEVEVRRFDDEIEGPVALVKIDVEGWEREVLAGATNRLSGPDAPALIVEHSPRTHRPDDPAREVVDLPRRLNAGYRVFRQLRGKDCPSPLVELEPRARLPHHDNVILLREEHLARLAEAAVVVRLA